jgi:hypothetical protein
MKALSSVLIAAGVAAVWVIPADAQQVEARSTLAAPVAAEGLVVQLACGETQVGRLMAFRDGGSALIQGLDADRPTSTKRGR